jgi:hypothetical protein
VPPWPRSGPPTSGQGGDDLQPGGDVDQRVEFFCSHARTSLRRCCQTVNAALPSIARESPMPMISQQSIVLPPGARNPVATGGQALTGEDVTYLARDAVWVAVQSRLKITPLGWG